MSSESTVANPVWIIGSGGHSAVVIAMLQASNIPVAGILDDQVERLGQRVLGVPVVGRPSELAPDFAGPAIIAIGRNQVRLRLAANWPACQWVSVVHPHAWVHESVSLGPGSVVCAGAVIQPRAVLGPHCLINTGASVDHDCILGAGVHLAQGCRLGGGVRLGDGVWLRLGAGVETGNTITAWEELEPGLVRRSPQS